jgi:hypothetical protein
MQHRELRGQSTVTTEKEEKNTGNAEAGARGDRRKDADKVQYRLTAASKKEKAPNRIRAWFFTTLSYRTCNGLVKKRVSNGSV